MLHNSWQIITPLMALTINIIVQIFMVQITGQGTLLKSVFSGAFAGGVGLLMMDGYIYHLSAHSLSNYLPYVLVNLIIYLCLCWNYLNFVNMGETARRIRILREIYEVPHGISLPNLLKRYNAEEGLNRRLERLLKNDQITLKEEKVFLKKSSVLIIAKCFRLAKLILLKKESEFD